MFCIGWRNKKKIKPTWGETVAVGFPTGRTDGLMALHVGPTHTLLDTNERHALTTLLSGENHCDHSWHYTNCYDGGNPREVDCVCTRCGKVKWRMKSELSVPR